MLVLEGGQTSGCTLKAVCCLCLQCCISQARPGMVGHVGRVAGSPPAAHALQPSGSLHRPWESFKVTDLAIEQALIPPPCPDCTQGIWALDCVLLCSGVCRAQATPLTCFPMKPKQARKIPESPCLSAWQRPGWDHTAAKNGYFTRSSQKRHRLTFLS